MNRSRQQSLFDDSAETPWEVAADADQLCAQVVLNKPLDTIFHYLVPDRLREIIVAGQRVNVPFGRGNRPTIGYCVGVERPRDPSRKLKAIDSVVDQDPLLSDQMLKLTRWIAGYYLCGWGQVIDSVVPGGVKNKAGTRLVRCFQVAPAIRAELSELQLPPKQRAVLQVLCSTEEALSVDELSKAAGCGTGPINALRTKGLIQALRQRTQHFTADLGPIDSQADLTLNVDQQPALEKIVASLSKQEHRTFLLHGVTGSGKTEVYIQAIREVVGYGRQAIVLVPEISLTPQTIRRFRSRFESVAVLHSHLSDAERHWHWQQIARGAVQVVVGARSAVFAPTPHLGLIVIDEEHESTFKQETTPRYHARDVARRRAELENVPLILGSATPSLESWLRVQRKTDTLLSMPQRVEQLPLPPVVVVDIRNDPYCSRGEAIGRALRSAMKIELDDGGQVILFLNLRGFSPVLWCPACGETVRCPHCDISLTWHKDRHVALCHSCDFQVQPPTHCPGCSQAGMRYLGTGTQRLEKEVQAKFPQAKCLRMDSDSMRKPGSHDVALEKFRSGEVQILLGTQMIAKGLDFPNVTLVGVIDADTILHQPDLRAAERTFQLISQVAGRTGRSSRGGRVFVQSSSPAEPAILKAADHDYLGFASAELKHRHERHTPPFVHLARVIFRGSVEESVRAHAKQVAESLRAAVEQLQLPIRLLGPSPAPIARLKKYFRYHLQLTAEQADSIHLLWHHIAAELPSNSEVEQTIDIDPVNMR